MSEYLPPLENPTTPKKKSNAWVAWVLIGLVVLIAVAASAGETGSSSTGTTTTVETETSIDGMSASLIEESADVAWAGESTEERASLCWGMTNLPRDDMISAFQTGSGWTYDQSAYAVNYTADTYC